MTWKNTGAVVCGLIHRYLHAWSTSVLLSEQLLRMPKWQPHCSTGTASLASWAQPGEIGPVHVMTEMPLNAAEILCSVCSVSSVRKSSLALSTVFSDEWSWLKGSFLGKACISVLASNSVCFVSGNGFSFWSQRFDKENPHSAHGHCSNEGTWEGPRNVGGSPVQLGQVLRKHPRAPQDVAGQHGQDTREERRLLRGNWCNWKLVHSRTDAQMAFW